MHDRGFTACGAPVDVRRIPARVPAMSRCQLGLGHLGRHSTSWPVDGGTDRYRWEAVAEPPRDAELAQVMRERDIAVGVAARAFDALEVGIVALRDIAIGDGEHRGRGVAADALWRLQAALVEAREAGDAERRDRDGDALRKMREDFEAARERWREYRLGTDGGAQRDGVARRPVPASEASAPDLVSRMIDARSCLRSGQYDETHRAVAGALRWLDEGIEEGMVQREMYADLRQLVAGDPHVCSCDDSPGCAGCSEGFGDRCRFEAALRSLLAVEAVPE